MTREEIAAQLLAGLLANPAGPIQHSSSQGWDFCNCNGAQVVELALGLAEELQEQARKSLRITVLEKTGDKDFDSGGKSGY